MEEDFGLGWYDYGARWYDASIGRWNAVDPLSEITPDQSPFHYTYNNPILFNDPTGLSGESTHTDSVGNVIAVYNDGDLGVYRHRDATTRGEVDAKRENTGTTSGGGEHMGETAYIDEFVEHDNDTGEPLFDKVIEGARIILDGDWGAIIDMLYKDSQKWGLLEIANRSKPYQKYDIKNNDDYAPYGPGTGRKLNGKYATARSAGNYLAGKTAQGGTLFGVKISLDTYLKLAGALHRGKWSKANAARIVLFGESFGEEIPYAKRRIISGWNSGASPTLPKSHRP